MTITFYLRNPRQVDGNHVLEDVRVLVPLRLHFSMDETVSGRTPTPEKIQHLHRKRECPSFTDRILKTLWTGGQRKTIGFRAKHPTTLQQTQSFLGLADRILHRR
jgi:hypothetical protein